MKDTHTMIMISKNTREQLQTIRITPRESYNEIIDRLLLDKGNEHTEAQEVYTR